MVNKNYYNEMTKLIYQDLAWGPIYKKNDGAYIKDTDNKSEIYIKQSLKIMKIPLRSLKNKKVFNIGTGRESRFFAKHGSEVTHLDIGEETVKELKAWAKKNNKKVHSFSSDIKNAEIGLNKYDIIFLSGIYQHIEKPAFALVKFINALKKNGKMYMGFYRSGEFKYFIVDAIRYLMSLKQISEIRNMNAILFTLGEVNHYQSSRVMDDFFVPRKHNFHPNDIINDIKLLGAKVFYFDNDFRQYNHSGSDYFSIGGDRIYITKKNDKIIKLAKIKKKLRTIKGKNQISDISYKEKIINENIRLLKKIKKKFLKKQINTTDISALCIGLYQFTRPMIFEQSEYFQQTKKLGRHKTINKFLINFLNHFDQKKFNVVKINKKILSLRLK
tara:strand:+ start:862 stop:2019 length:1158 start_codon:yes stop_codon:yes gene_type:complete